jgi:hypothetical protein
MSAPTSSNGRALNGTGRPMVRCPECGETHGSPCTYQLCPNKKPLSLKRRGQ